MTDQQPLSAEFIAEVQELIDGLGSDLLALDKQRDQDRLDPERINSLFRRAHSLKGLAGMFGLDQVITLSHGLEEVLDGLRLGKLPLTRHLQDICLQCIELFSQLLGTASTGAEPRVEVDTLLLAIAQLWQPKAELPAMEILALSHDITSVLTEYEEHRLQENIRQQRQLYLLRTSFDLSSFDVSLHELEAILQGVGEIISKLPSSQSHTPSQIGFDILIGTSQPVEQIRQRLQDHNITMYRLGQAEPTPSVMAPSSSPAGAPSGSSLSIQSPAIPVVVESTQEKNLEGAQAASGRGGEKSEGVAGEDKESGSLRSVSQSVRVDIQRLDSLMNVVGELTLSKQAFQRFGQIVKDIEGLAAVSAEVQRECRGFERRLAELQSGIMDVRLVPMVHLFERLVRASRKMARELGKEIKIEISGEHTELDKLIVEDLADPLVHLLRNAIDHGIEPAEQRLAAGKHREGLIQLHAIAGGNHVVVEMRDDGHGIDIQSVLQKAMAKQLVTPEQAANMEPREVYQLLFLPGFSTRETVSAYSGRGVGLDVVKTNIAKLSGMIEVESTPGQGTCMRLTLPITLAIISALIVQSRHTMFAVPLNNVMETLELQHGAIQTVEHQKIISLRGATVPLCDVRRLFSLGDDQRPETSFAVVAGIAQSQMALLVDEVLGQQDIVIKSLGKRLRQVPGIAGAAELGHQEAILVIDVMQLAQEMQEGRLLEKTHHGTS